MRTDYLDHLAALLGCNCLSDLRDRTLTPDEAHKLLSEPIDYPLPQYVEAVRYIMVDRAPPVTTPKEAVQSIVNYLN